jgi:chromosome partitioning protein
MFSRKQYIHYWIEWQRRQPQGRTHILEILHHDEEGNYMNTDMHDAGGSVHLIGINKGGGTKTTTAVNMGVMLNLLGCSTLMVDAAPEAHTTYSFGYLPDQIGYSLYDLLAKKCSLEDVVVPTYYDLESRTFFCPTEKVDPSDPHSLTLLQANGQNNRVIRGPDLIPLKLSDEGDEIIRGKPLKELLLRKALIPARKRYDYIMCDSNPDLLNILTKNGVYAADWVCIPFVPEQLTAVGFGNIYNAIQQAQEEGNPHLKIAGVVLNKVRDLNVHKDVIDPFREITALQDIRIFETIIRDNPKRFLEAANRRSVVVLNDHLSESAFEYWGFLAEYLDVVGGPGKQLIKQTLQHLLKERQQTEDEREHRRQIRALKKSDVR